MVYSPEGHKESDTTEVTQHACNSEHNNGPDNTQTVKPGASFLWTMIPITLMFTSDMSMVSDMKKKRYWNENLEKESWIKRRYMI